MAAQGGWWQLLDIRKQAQEEFDFWAGPTADSGSSAELYCPFDGWQYPRDYVRPQRL